MKRLRVIFCYDVYVKYWIFGRIFNLVYICIFVYCELGRSIVKIEFNFVLFIFRL